MSVRPGFDGIQGPNTNMTAADFTTGFVGGPSGYSTAMGQQLALPVPLGSQLNLLNMQYAGNPYMNFNRTSDQRLTNAERMLKGYNTLTDGGNGSYYSFGKAYGMA